MSEFDARNYVPEDVQKEDLRTAPHFQKAAKTSGSGFYHQEFFQPERAGALPEIIRVSAPQEAEGLLISNGNVVAIFADVLEHDKLQSRKISKYPEPDKYEIHADGLPIGMTNNGEIDLDKLKETLIN